MPFRGGTLGFFKFLKPEISLVKDANGAIFHQHLSTLSIQLNTQEF